MFTDRGGRLGASRVGLRAAIAVYETPVHNGNELVAKIMGEDVPE